MASLGAEVGFVLTNQAVRVVGLFIAVGCDGVLCVLHLQT